MKDRFKNVINIIGIPKLLIIIAAGIMLIIPTRNVNVNKNTDEINEEMNVYETRLEKELADILSNVKGIGKTRVMITLKPDEHTFSDKNTEVMGVLVAATMGNSDAVKKEIIEAAEVLFEIEPHKIKVMKLE